MGKALIYTEKGASKPFKHADIRKADMTGVNRAEKGSLTRQ